jgi:hypothetical protein
MKKQRHRVSGLWYANDAGWVQAILGKPPSYTRPDCDLLAECDRRYF